MRLTLNLKSSYMGRRLIPPLPQPPDFIRVLILPPGSQEQNPHCAADPATAQTESLPQVEPVARLAGIRGEFVLLPAGFSGILLCLRRHQN